ncbi:unnamed protein product, partial [Polarella glacialis]
MTATKVRRKVEGASPSRGGSRPGTPADGSRPGTPADLQRARRNERVNNFLDRQCELSPQNEIRLGISVMQRELAIEMRTADDAGLLGSRGVEGFRKMLISRYGTVAAGWRMGLDRDGNGRVSFGELCLCCRDMGFHGNLRKLWMELDADHGGFISLNELDPAAFKDLEDFKCLCYEKFGNMIAAWEQGLNPDGHVGIAEKEFISRIGTLGFPGDARRLFRWLRTDLSRSDLGGSRL